MLSYQLRNELYSYTTTIPCILHNFYSVFQMSSLYHCSWHQGSNNVPLKEERKKQNLSVVIDTYLQHQQQIMQYISCGATKNDIDINLPIMPSLWFPLVFPSIPFRSDLADGYGKHGSGITAAKTPAVPEADKTTQMVRSLFFNTRSSLFPLSYPLDV